MRSSYIENNYGDVIYSYITGVSYPPIKCVELGVLDGYSTYHIARALKYNKKEGEGGNCHLDAYDLWEKYPYKHGKKEEVQKLLEEKEVNELVTLLEEDAFEVHKNYKDGEVYFLHIDISNTGDKIERLINVWDKKLVVGSIVVIEGGSEERDKIEWMVKYNQKPIKPVIEKNEIINKNYVYATYKKYPSMTVMLKKWENV